MEPELKPEPEPKSLLKSLPKSLPKSLESPLEQGSKCDKSINIEKQVEIKAETCGDNNRTKKTRGHNIITDEYCRIEQIENLAYKIKLKLFILDKTNKYKNKPLNRDILQLIVLIVTQHQVQLNERDQQTIVKLFAKIESLDKQLQLEILKTIMLYLN